MKRNKISPVYARAFEKPTAQVDVKKGVLVFRLREVQVSQGMVTRSE